MANTTENDDKKKKKPLTLSRPGKLELKKTVEGGQVRQSFSHGRTKTVTVEVKKKRTFQQGAAGEMTEVKDAPEEEVFEQAPAPEQPAEEAPKPQRTLTEAEQAARARALEEARLAAFWQTQLGDSPQLLNLPMRPGALGTSRAEQVSKTFDFTFCQN